MLQSRLIMGMPVTIEIVDPEVSEKIFDTVFAYFKSIDEKFSPFKQESEVTLINEGRISVTEYSQEMREIIRLAEETKQETRGYFDIFTPDGKFNPSGIVKGWAIYNAAKIIKDNGFENFYVNAGGDIQFYGRNAVGKTWRTGIENPFNPKEIVKVVELSDKGIATSGTYLRGQHIYNPHHKDSLITEIVSLTVIGPDVYEADRFATAAFAMGFDGINFIERLPGFEGYMIDKNGRATMTSFFEKYLPQTI